MSKGDKLSMVARQFVRIDFKKEHIARCINALKPDSNVEIATIRAYEQVLSSFLNGSLNVEITDGEKKQCRSLLNRLAKKYPQESQDASNSLEQSVLIIEKNAKENPISKQEVQSIIEKDVVSVSADKPVEKEVFDLEKSVIMVQGKTYAEALTGKKEEVPAPSKSYVEAEQARENSRGMCVIS